MVTSSPRSGGHAQLRTRLAAVAETRLHQVLAEATPFDRPLLAVEEWCRERLFIAAELHREDYLNIAEFIVPTIESCRATDVELAA